MDITAIRNLYREKEFVRLELQTIAKETRLKQRQPQHMKVWATKLSVTKPVDDKGGNIVVPSGLIGGGYE